MTIRIFIILSLLTSKISFAQNKSIEINPVIGVSSNLNTGWNMNPLSEYSFHPGIYFDNRILIALNTSATFPIVNNTTPKYYHYWNSSLTISTRVVDNYRLVNPVFLLCGGFGYPNKNTDVYISNSMFFLENANYDVAGKFRKVGLFGSMQFGIGFYPGNFILTLTGGMQTMNMFYETIEDNPQSVHTKYSGFILSLSTSYKLHFHKKQLSKE